MGKECCRQCVKLLADAKTGKPSSLKSLSLQFQSNVEHLTVEVVELLLSHFDESKLLKSGSSPSSSSSRKASDRQRSQSRETTTNDIQNVLRAHSVLLGFEGDFLNVAALEERHHLEFEPLLIARWNGVQKWIWYFLGKAMEGPENASGLSPAKESLIESMVNLMAFCRCFDGVRQVVDDTPGVLKLMTLLWLQHQKLSTLRPSGCMLMSSFIRERIVKKRSFDEILDAVDGDPVVIIEALLEPFRQFLEKPTSSSEGRAITSIIFLYQLTRRPKHVLCRRLLQKNAVPLVFRFLLKWIQNPLLQSSDKRSVVSDSFKFFDGLAHCAPGVTWVIQAFRAGLLEFYVRTWPIIADMPRKDIDLLLHCFTCVSMRYLHDLQVVETARDALAKDLNVQGVDVDWHAEDDDQQPEYQTPLGTLIMFRDLLQKRVNVAEDIPYGTIRKNCQICDFCFNYESTLMACQGCRQAFYCSKTCQSQGWKVGGHRDKCRKMRWRKEPNRSLVKDIQLLFLKTVVVYEMASFADKFFPCEFMVRKRYRPGEEIQNFIVEADFWATPGGNVSVDIQGGDIRFDEEEAAESGALSGSIQPEVQEVKLSKSATGHILVTQPHGEDKQEAYITTSDLWHDLQRFSGLKEPPTIIIRRP